jgi:hypothetical protein
MGGDRESEQLVETISACLEKYIGPDAAMLFRSTTGIRYTNVQGEGTFGYENEVRRQRAIDFLEHLATQLKEIVKGL